MKRQIVTAIVAALALMAFQACQKESVVGKIDPEAQKAGIMRVNAGEPKTKTYIFENGTDQGKPSYALGWSKDDVIGCYEVSTVNGTPTIQTTRVTSSPLANDASSATFTMNFTGNSGEANFSYIFVYPAASYTVKNADNGTYRGIIPQQQTFAQNSFDKNADLLISEPIMNQPSRPTDVSARFERIGSTVLMNIKAPGTNEKIRKITFSTTENSKLLQGYYEIRPIDGEYDIAPYSGSKSIELTPATETIYKGIIPVWFRCSETTLSNNFTVVVTTNKKIYSKTVDLATLSRQLAFENAGLTKFNVDMEPVVGEDNPYLEDDDYIIVAQSGTAYYALTNTDDGSGKTRLAYSTLTDFDPTASAYYTDNNSIVWTLANGADNFTLQDNADNYLNQGDKKASVTSTSASFTLSNGGIDGDGIQRYRIYGTDSYKLCFNSTFFAFYTSDTGVYNLYVLPRDTRSRVAAPSNVDADASGSTITVIWDDAVDENIDHYLVTLSGSADDSQDVNPGVETCDFTGLDDGTYTITVEAVPVNTVTHLNSVPQVVEDIDVGSVVVTSYTKVTSAPANWAGTYIIVYEESSTSGLVCTAGVDAASNYVSATISSSTISSNSLGDYEVEVTAYSTGYTMKALGGDNANKYLEGKGSTNGTTFAAASSKVTTFSISNGKVTITNNANIFSYNSTAGNLRWRFFKSSTVGDGSGGYKIPCLYKKN